MHFNTQDVGRALEIFGAAQHGGVSNGWDFYCRSYPNADHGKFTTFNVPLLGTVSIVQYVRTGDDYPEQGAKIWLVFEVVTPGGDGPDYITRYFKMDGVTDSYDEISWCGPFSEVRPKEKMIVSYEYV